MDDFSLIDTKHGLCYFNTKTAGVVSTLLFFLKLGWAIPPDASTAKAAYVRFA